MFKKVWEALFLLAVLVFGVQLAIASLRPLLPILGIVLLVIITGVLVKVFWFRRKFW
jgi:hypothetical protein